MNKKQALNQARKMRKTGLTVKVFCRSGIYTQPGVGIATFVEYFVKVI